MTFSGEASPGNTNLYCSRNVDRFSISNPFAKLDYPVGLISVPEINILNNGRIISYLNSYFWTMTPHYFASYSNQHHVVQVYELTGAGSLTSFMADNVYSDGLRPVISLKPGIAYESGNGSKGNPYYIKTD